MAIKIHLYEKLLTLCLLPDGTVRENIQAFLTTRTELKAVGMDIDDTLYKLSLLRSLSGRFDALVIALESQLDYIKVDGMHANITREDAR